MVTLKGYTANYAGKSTDTKPTDVEINTIFHALDTDKYYYFDGTQWNEIPNTGGGGGGGDITSANVTAMTGYEIAEEADAIETTDTLNEAIGKLEKGVSDNETNISSLQDKTDRIVMDSNETTILYFQGTQPSNPHDGDCWIDCSTT